MSGVDPEPYIVETPRVGMRPMVAADAEPFFALCTDPQVMRYVLDEPPPADVADMRRRIEEYPDHRRYGFGRWACIEKSTGRFIGFSGLKRLPDFDDEVDLGYRFFPDCWGKGYATETGRASMRYGFEVLGLDRIIGLVLPENVASVRVLEKCGMRFERTAVIDGHEAAVYVGVKSTLDGDRPT